MSPGKINGPLELVITHLKAFDSLLNFTCGIPEMDPSFIPDSRTLSLTISVSHMQSGLMAK